MRVVAEPPKDWSLDTQCPRCSARLQVNLADFKRTSHDQRDGSSANYVCPVCQNHNWVDLKVIPREFHWRLPR